MVIRLVYNPAVEWDVHRFEVSAPSVIRAVNMIDAPKEVQDGDLIIHEANAAYLCNQGLLKPVSMEEVAKMRPPQKCTNCELSKTALNTCVKADHPGGEIDILFLGMAPGREEDIEKVSFVETAPAASIIKNIVYNEIGIPRDRVAWTNITKCFPTENGVMRDPSKEEMLECSGSWLWEEILAYNPKLIVVFGSTATQFLLQNEIPITKIRGSINKVLIKGKEFKVLPCIHPSSVAHGNREFLKAIRDDVNLAWSLVNSKYNEMPQCHILNDTDSIINVCKKVINLYNEKVISSISLDIESDYLHKELDEGEEANKDLFDVNHTIVGFAISWDENFAVWFTLDHAESKVDIPKVTPYLKEMLELVPIEAHHGKYDQSWLKEKLGINTVLSFDTMLGSFALHGQSRSHGLKPLLRSVFAWPPYESHIAQEVMSLPPEKRTYKYVKLETVGTYCCYDTAGTRKLVNYQKSQLSEVKLELANLLSRTSDTLMKAELNGVPIDLRRVKADETRYQNESDIDSRLLHEHPKVQQFLAYKKLVNPKDSGVFNPNSPNDVKALLFGLSVCNDCKHTSNSKAKKIVLPSGKEVKPVYPFRFKCCPACNSINTTDYDFLCCEPKGITAAGAPSTDQETLDDLAEELTHRHISLVQGENSFFCKKCRKDVDVDDSYHINYGKEESVRFFQLINRLKKRGKIQQFWNGMKEYYRPVINEQDETALLIVNYRQTLVVTGRLQASNYSVHTLPASSDIRRSVVSRSIRRGGLVLNADYAQVEPRILASVAKCEGFIQIFREGRDIYRGAASSLLKISDDEVSKAIREFMKGIFLGITYGKSDKAVARDCGVLLHEATEFINNLLHKQFPELGQWIERTHKEVRTTGKIESINGRVYFLPDAQLPDVKQNFHKIHTAYRHAQNYGIQGPASDVTCEAATQIVKEIERQKIEAELFGLIHDQLVTGIGPGTILPMLKTCDYAMKELAPKVFPWITVPLNIEMEIGARFDGGVIVTEFDDNSFTCKGMENFFDELIETAKLGYNKVTVEMLKKEPVKRKEEILIKKAYNGDKGGDHEIKARVYVE